MKRFIVTAAATAIGALALGLALSAGPQDATARRTSFEGDEVTFTVTAQIAPVCSNEMVPVLGKRITVRFVLHHVSCDKGHRLIRTYFNDVAKKTCTGRGSGCIFSYPGGWFCGNAHTERPAIAACETASPPTAKVTVYRVTRKSSMSNTAHPSCTRRTLIAGVKRGAYPQRTATFSRGAFGCAGRFAYATRAVAHGNETEATSATAAAACSNITVSVFGKPTTLRFVLRGIRCSKASSLIRMYFRKATVQNCRNRGNECIFNFAGGWTCSFIFASEHAGLAGCYRSSSDRFNVYRVTRRMLAEATANATQPQPIYVNCWAELGHPSYTSYFTRREHPSNCDIWGEPQALVSLFPLRHGRWAHWGSSEATVTGMVLNTHYGRGGPRSSPVRAGRAFRVRGGCGGLRYYTRFSYQNPQDQTVTLRVSAACKPPF